MKNFFHYLAPEYNGVSTAFINALQDLFEMEGLALSHSRKFDVIVKYFI